MSKRMCCILLTVILALSGCGDAVPLVKTGQETQRKEQVKEETDTVEQPVLAGEVSFELPVSTVRALVDRNGYAADREKMVVFLGENLTGGFRVVRESDWEVVYIGTIQKASQEEDSHYENLNVGDFSDVTEPGTYYIEQEQVGRSYTFSISEDVYEPVFNGLLENIFAELGQTESVNASDVCDISFGMHSMMLALQCHGALFEKDNNLVTHLLETAQWLMTMQDASTGSMLEDYEATAAFCGILAQSAEAFGKYDANVSKEFMAASKKAWKWLEKQTKDAGRHPSAQFYAAAQLFKAEGTRSYALMIEEYLESRKEKITQDRFAFYGSTIYLNTVKNTNRDLCTKIMQELVDETEEISRKVKENPYWIYSDDMTQNLQKVLLICFVDYITPSNEYAVIIENTLHYLLGRNKTGSCYLDKTGRWLSAEETAQRTLEWNGIVLFCLSDLINDAADDVEKR